MRVVFFWLSILSFAVVSFVFAADYDLHEGDTGQLTLEGARQVGEQMSASFNLGNYTVPAGQSVAINVDVLASPDGSQPLIIPGFPKTSMVFETPGSYTLNFRLNQICKTSCGGLTARPLLEKTESFEILE